jgi:hypothetical protein
MTVDIQRQYQRARAPEIETGSRIFAKRGSERRGIRALTQKSGITPAAPYCPNFLQGDPWFTIHRDSDNVATELTWISVRHEEHPSSQPSGLATLGVPLTLHQSPSRGKPRSPPEEKQSGRSPTQAEEDLQEWRKSHPLPTLSSIKMGLKLNPDRDNEAPQQIENPHRGLDLRVENPADAGLAKPDIHPPLPGNSASQLGCALEATHHSSNSALSNFRALAFSLTVL